MEFCKILKFGHVTNKICPNRLNPRKKHPKIICNFEMQLDYPIPA